MDNPTEISIPDGPSRAYTYLPKSHDKQPLPAVIVFMDAPAIRPALHQLCQRLADHGYFVLLPDMFWRAGPYPAIDWASSSDENVRRERSKKLMATTDTEKSMKDTEMCLKYLETNTLVKGTKVGVVGYCMGCGMALRASGHFPDRISVVAGFHGGRLHTDAPDSPHLLAPKIKAKVLVCGADNDASFPPEQAEQLSEALTQAGVSNTVTIYKGAKHGYAPTDTPAYNAEASERHWVDMFSVLDSVLKGNQ